MTQKCCPVIDCAIEQGRRDAVKKSKRDIRIRKAAAKPRMKYMAEAQAAVNKWIRVRDAAEPCISCGRHHQGQFHAGHYLSVGARPGLRFDPRNIHKQCQPCNTHLHGNLVLYRAALIAKIGISAVEEMEADISAKKYSIAELVAIRADAAAKLKGAA